MMGTLEILERLKTKVEEWAWRTNKMCGGSVGKDALDTSKKAYFDFCELKDEIEKSLDEMAEKMLEEEKAKE